MKITFVTRTPTNQFDFIKFRLPIKQEPYFDRELIWLSCVLVYAQQGIDLRGHVMIEPMLSCGGQPVRFSEWEATQFRIMLPMESYQEQRRQLEASINDIFDPNTRQTSARPDDGVEEEYDGGGGDESNGSETDRGLN